MMRNKILLAALLLMSLLLVGFVYRQARVQWEYRVIDNANEKKLDELGSEGWELVSVEPLASGGSTLSAHFYLKRQK
jgi:hypothetical protein